MLTRKRGQERVALTRMTEAKFPPRALMRRAFSGLAAGAQVSHVKRSCDA